MALIKVKVINKSDLKLLNFRLIMNRESLRRFKNFIAQNNKNHREFT